MPGALLSALCLLASAGAAMPASAMPAAMPAAAASAPEMPGATESAPGAPAVTSVADGPSRSLGEPAAAQDESVGVVAATRFQPQGAAQVDVWTRPAGSANWRPAGTVLPSGFGSSYDAAAAAAPGGPALVAVGTDPPGQNCISGGSVAVAAARSSGRLGPARLVSDQRGTGRFDDRPSIAVGPGGTVWVAWSEGPDADSCQDVGTGDRLEVAVSHDGGQTFGAPVALPAGGGNSAFGARLVPLPGGQAAVSWTEQFPGQRESVLVSVIGRGGHPSPPRRVLTGTAPPLDLPGASFYDFPAGDIAALPGGLLTVAVPLWQSGRAVLGLATGTAGTAGTTGGAWRESEVSPTAGSDLLLPGLAPATAGTVRLLCAVHSRSGDRLGYDAADLRVAPGSAPVPVGRLTPVTPAPGGPGFFEIGEELSLVQVPGGLLSPVAVAGGSSARLETLTWRQPAVPAAGGAGGTSTESPGSPAASASRGPGPRRSPAAGAAKTAARKAVKAASGHPAPGIAGPAWTAAVLIVIVVAGLLAWRGLSRPPQ